MDKKNLVIAFLLGALLIQPAKASYEDYVGLQGAKILASAMIKSAKIIGLGASTSGTSGVVDLRRANWGINYWDFVKMIPEKVD